MTRFEPTFLRSLAYGFSAASLLLLPVWHDIFSRRGTIFDESFLSNHHQIAATARLDYVAGLAVTIALSLIAAAAIAGAGAKSPRLGRTVAMSIAVALALYGLNVVRVSFMPWASLSAIASLAAGRPVTFGVAAAAGIAALLVLFRVLRDHLTRAVMVGAPIGAVLLFNAAGAAVVLGKSAFLVSGAALAGMARGLPARRVAWIVFDEADYRLLFERRPDGLALANFDRLRRRGLEARRAVPPGGSTFPSVPALIGGRPVVWAGFAADGARIRLRRDAPSQPWTDRTSVFAAARARGLNAAALGQAYIPYCRIFHRVLTRCWEMGRPWAPGGVSAAAQIGAFLGRLAAYVPVLNRWLRPELFDSGAPYRRFLAGAQEALADPRFALVYLHWNVPHAPYVFDRRTGSFIDPTEETSRYFDNAALADRMLGAMMQRLDAAGLARRTAVIVTSDHHWRRSAREYDGVSDDRVPFILSFAAAPRRVVVSEPFDTVVTKDLVLAILDGRVRTPEAAAAFIGAGRALPARRGS